jgi:retinol dehydrogenase-12
LWASQISNAGIATEKFVRTVDGFESTYVHQYSNETSSDTLSSSQVNNIANSLLSVLLLPKLQQTAKLPAPSGSPNLKPHLSIVASEVHHWINGILPGMTENRKDTLQCFQEEALFVPKQRYPESKGTFSLVLQSQDLEY